MLRSGGDRATIATLRNDDDRSEWIEVVARGPFGTISPSGRSRLRGLLEGADCLHIHGVWEPSAAQAASISRRMDIPYVVSLHGMLDDWAMGRKPIRKRAFLSMFAGSMLRQAMAVHCASGGGRRQASRRALLSQFVEVPQPIDLEGLPIAEPAKPHNVMLVLGRLHPVKGPDIAIEALSILRRSGWPLRLRFPGGGPASHVASLRSLADSLGVADSVEWLGHLDRRARADAIAGSMIAVAPTSQENFGVALFEALASGLPLVASECLDTRDELVASGGAITVPRSAASFAESIAGLCDDPDTRARMGADGRRWTRDWLDPATLRQRYLDLYLGAPSAMHSDTAARSPS